MSPFDPDSMREWTAAVRDAVLLVTGVVITVRLVWTDNPDPGLVGLALAMIGAGAYGRGVANGQGKR